MLISLKERKISVQYQLLIDENDGAIIFDEKGFITYTNDSLCDMIGYSRDKMIGKHIVDFLAVKSKKTNYRKILEWSGNRIRCELQFITSTNRKIDVLMSVIPMSSSKAIASELFAVMVDITKYKQLESDFVKKEHEIETIKLNLKKIYKSTTVYKGGGWDPNKISPASKLHSDVSHQPLTSSELRIADLIDRGKTTKEIGAILCISERTVSNHRQNIRRKLGLVKKR